MLDIPKYPPHIYEQIRRDIANEYLSHEFRKLFSSIDDPRTLKHMDQEIATWFDGHYALTPVRDFWNGLHGIARGFKLKNIVSYLTSEHISWSVNDIELTKLNFGTTLDEMRAITDSRKVTDVIAAFQALPEKKQNEIRKHHFSQYTHKQEVNHYCLIAVEKENTPIVVDGNRRLFEAILRGDAHIKTAIGKQTGTPLLYNDWVPTSLLCDIVGLARTSTMGKEVSLDSLADTILSLIKHSIPGQIEFFERAIVKGNEYDEEVGEKVRRQLKMNN